MSVRRLDVPAQRSGGQPVSEQSARGDDAPVGRVDSAQTAHIQEQQSGLDSRPLDVQQRTIGKEPGTVLPELDTGGLPGQGGALELLNKKLQIESGLAAAQLSSPPVIEELEPEAEVQAQLEEDGPEPDLATSGLGKYAGLAQWIDTHLGDKDGAISGVELWKFAEMYGQNENHHVGIKGLASKLKVKTVREDGALHIATRQSSSASTTSNSSETSSASSTTRAASTTGTDKAQVIARLVSQVGTASRADVDRIKGYLAAAPLAVLRAMERNGYKIKVCGVVSEARPDLKGKAPRGAPPGATWDQVGAGLHAPDRNEIVISKLGVKKGSVLHEVGHALDAMRQRSSKKSSFGRAYESARAKLESKSEAYLLQPGEAGLSECYAEAFSRYCSSEEQGALRRDYPSLYGYFDKLEDLGWIS